MKWRIAINGYGRIGQSILRALYESDLRDKCSIVAINELADIDTIAYLTRYDTTHGRFRLPVSVENAETLCIDGDRIKLSHHEGLEHLPWHENNVDIVFECTGAYSSREEAEKHIACGAKFVLFSQPASHDVDKTIVFGVNENSLDAQDRIVSNASCTTNAIVPVLNSLHSNFGVLSGSLMTIHSAMNDQPIIDAYHTKDLRLTRSAMSSIIPVNTGLDRGIARLIPSLAGKISSNAVRVPTINVSLIDMVVRTREDVTAEQVNTALQVAASSKYASLLGYTQEAHASVDFNHDPRSVIIDGTQTQVVDGRLVKLLCWFDNEWGYANRMLDVACYWQQLLEDSAQH